MPALYSRSAAPGQLPLTPPDSGSGFAYSNMHYPQDPYLPPHQSMSQSSRQHEPPYDYRHQAYLPTSLPPAPPSYPHPYQQPPAYQSTGTTLPSISSYYEPIGAPILPPLRIRDRLPYADEYPNPLPQYQPAPPAEQLAPPRVEAKEEKPTGGVSAKLDYDMDRMTDFVVSTTQQIFHQNVSSPPSFRKWVHQVLSATRLPSTTILLSLHYLSDRLRIFPQSVPAAENQVYRLLAVALILGSKFLDDNTFINRSWSDVTAIKVTELNLLELKWLRLIEYGLHVEDSCLQSWLDLWTKFNMEQTQKQQSAIRLSPLDTNLNRSADRYSPYPTPYTAGTPSSRVFDTPHSSISRSSHYSSTPYSAVDPWAPTERPAAFEQFYKRSGAASRYPTLTDIDDANRRASEEQLRARQPQYPAVYSSYQPMSAGPYSRPAAPPNATCWDPYSWNNFHRTDCACNNCAYRAWRPYPLANGYGMGTVMG